MTDLVIILTVIGIAAGIVGIMLCIKPSAPVRRDQFGMLLDGPKGPPKRVKN